MVLTDSQMRAQKKYRAKPEVIILHNAYSREWQLNKYNTDPEFKARKLAYAKSVREAKKKLEKVIVG